MPKVRLVCSRCKSDEVVKDVFLTTTTWDVEQQTWILHSYYDATYCNTCEESCNLEDEECEDSSGSGDAP